MVSMFNIYQQPAWIILALLVIAAWTLLWKGFALWFSARAKQKTWFIVILIFNTMGLLPIIYLLWFKPKSPKTVVEKSKSAANNRVIKKDTPKKVNKKKSVRKKK